jgi:hypothetical protein
MEVDPFLPLQPGAHLVDRRWHRVAFASCFRPSSYNQKHTVMPASSPPLDNLEAIERDACLDLYAAAPDAVRQALRIVGRAIDGGALLLCPGIDHIMFNRFLTVGSTDRPHATELDHVTTEFERDGVKNWIVQVPPQAVGWAEVCARRGLQPHPRSWVKFHRSAGPLEAETLLSIREADASEAHAFAATAVTAFGMPAIVTDWFGALVGRRRWHCFLALESSMPVGAGALYIDGPYAWLGIGGTLSSRRRLGAQSALLAARISRAAELGCTWLTTETGLPHPGEAAPSYRNIQRAGFQISYVRPNLMRAG